MQSQFILLPFEDDRFWAKVDFDGPIPAHRPELGPCWIWTAAHHPLGYGNLTRRRFGGSISAHRYVYLMTYGAMTDDKVVCHSCDNPPCVNPAHLFAGTMRDNTRDMMGKGRNSMPPRPPIEAMLRGEKVWRAKLTADQVREIRARYAAGGITLQQLAEDYPVTHQGIYSVVSRETWKHIP